MKDISRRGGVAYVRVYNGRLKMGVSINRGAFICMIGTPKGNP